MYLITIIILLIHYYRQERRHRQATTTTTLLSAKYHLQHKLRRAQEREARCIDEEIAFAS